MKFFVFVVDILQNLSLTDLKSHYKAALQELISSSPQDPACNKAAELSVL